MMELHSLIQVLVSLHVMALAVGLTFNECNSGLAMRNLDGDVLIAGLFPLTYYNSKQMKYVRNNVAITWVEAFVFAIKQINNDTGILPGIKVGFDIRNSCNKENIALQNVLDFMLDLSVIQGNNKTLNKKCGCISKRNRIIAVVGGASSSISTSVSNVLSADDMPQISYSSTSVALSNKNKYPNFLRTLPSDIYQAKAIVALLREFKWTYVNVLASDDDYGRLGFYQLEKELKAAEMCLAEYKIFKRRLSNKSLDAIIQKIKKGLRKQAKVVILWCQINEAKIIIEEAWRHGLTEVTWLGCETLGNNQDLFELGGMVKGFVGLKPTLHRVEAFEEYLGNLTSLNKTGNPWIESYWESVDGCEPKSVINISSVGNTTTINPCAIKNGSKLPRSKYSHVISAVYAVLLALDNMTRNFSGNAQEKLTMIKPKSLYNEILSVDYRDPESDLNIKFDADGDPQFASYTFTAIMQKGGENDSLKFVDIGTWEGKTGDIVIFDVSWQENKNVTSQCSIPCNAGMFKIPGDVACCWTCVACKLDSITTNGNATFCTKCGYASISNKNRTKCHPLKELYFTTESNTFKVTIFASSVAIVCVAFVAILFVKYWNTPVVKSANRELSLLQLFMLFASLWYPVSYWMNPTTFQCTLQALWLSFCPTTVLAVTFVKTYRLYRIFNKKTTEESKLLQNKYQSLVVFFVLFLQTVLAVSWFQYYSLKIVRNIKRTEKSFMRNCCDNSGVILVILQCYNLAIALACASMAFRARKLPNAFNEARYITFGTFTYCITWMFAIPLFLSVSIIEKNDVICAMNIVSNFALFLCFFANKIRVILFLPQKNTKHYFTRQATIDQFSRTRTNTGMTSSWPTLPGVRSMTGIDASSALGMDQRHWSMGSLSSLVSNKKKGATCNPRTLKRYAQTPKDIVFAKYGRERSQTID